MTPEQLTRRPAVLNSVVRWNKAGSDRLPDAPFEGVLHERYRQARAPLVATAMSIADMRSSDAVQMCLEIIHGRDDAEARAFVEGCIRDRRRNLYNDGHPDMGRYRRDPEREAEAERHRTLDGEYTNLHGKYYLHLISELQGGPRQDYYDVNWTVPYEVTRSIWKDFRFQEFDHVRRERLLEEGGLSARHIDMLAHKDRPVPEVRYFPSAKNRALWVVRVRQARRSARAQVRVTVGYQHHHFARQLLTDPQRHSPGVYAPSYDATGAQLKEELQKVFALMRQVTRNQAEQFSEALA